MKKIVIYIFILVFLIHIIPLTCAEDTEKVWVMKTEAYPGKWIILWSDGSITEEFTSGTGEIIQQPITPPEGGIPSGPGDTTPPWLKNLGNILFKTAGMLFYDSGAMISTLSDLKYIPDYVSGTVKAFLSSGIGVETSKDGSAIITLLDGTKKKIDNIYGSYQALKNNWGWSSDGKTYEVDYLYAGYGSLWESKGKYESHMESG